MDRVQTKEPKRFISSSSSVSVASIVVYDEADLLFPIKEIVVEFFSLYPMEWVARLNSSIKVIYEKHWNRLCG